MRFPWFNASDEAVSLRRLLRRTQLLSSLLLIGLTSLAITLAGIFTIVHYANHSLSLLGRTIAYNVEAAIVFNDREAIMESLNYLAENEEIAEVLVHDNNGQLLSHWQNHEAGFWDKVERRLADSLLAQPFQQTVTQEDKPIGTLIVSIRGRTLSGLLLTTLLILSACVLFSLVMVHFSTHYMQRKIAVPLTRLATVVRSIARGRDFRLLAPPSRIKELNYLAEDFNSLLREIQIWQGHMQQEHALLSHKAQHDPLTGVPNRSQFEPALVAAMGDARKHGGSCALLFIDCDDFKTINDTLGHMAGDAVLLAVAQRLSQHLRKSDLVVRLGGDEFAVLLYPVFQPQDALFVADKMLNAFVEPLDVPTLDKALKVSISIGIAVYPLHADTPEGLVHAADAAMYNAKRTKTGKYMGGDYAQPHEEVVARPTTAFTKSL